MRPEVGGQALQTWKKMIGRPEIVDFPVILSNLPECGPPLLCQQQGEQQMSQQFEVVLFDPYRLCTLHILPVYCRSISN